MQYVCTVPRFTVNPAEKNRPCKTIPLRLNIMIMTTTNAYNAHYKFQLYCGCIKWKIFHTFVNIIYLFNFSQYIHKKKKKKTTSEWTKILGAKDTLENCSPQKCDFDGFSSWRTAIIYLSATSLGEHFPLDWPYGQRTHQCILLSSLKRVALLSHCLEVSKFLVWTTVEKLFSHLNKLFNLSSFTNWTATQTV